MTDFEKALKIDTDKFLKNNIAEENAITEEEKDLAIVFKSVTRTSFQSGARWAREFTVREIVKFISKWKDDLEVDYFDNDGDLRTEKLIDCIESHFSEQRQSDNGEERGGE